MYMHMFNKKCTAFLALFFIFVNSGTNAEILRNEADIWKHLPRVTIENDTSSDLQNFLSNLIEEPRDSVFLRAEQALQNGILPEDERFNVSDTCLRHTEMLLEALISRQDWAWRMIDAMGKPSSGLMNGQLHWLGSYDECVAVQAAVNVSGERTSSLSGRYCEASIGRKQQSVYPVMVRIGLCVPNSCSSNDTASLTYTLLSLFPNYIINMTTLPKPTVKCQQESLELDTKAIIVIIVTSLFGLVMTIATVYDVIVAHWINAKTTKITKYEVTKDESEKTTPFGVDNKGYGTTESLKAAEANGDIVQSSGVSKADLVKVDVERTEKDDIYKPGKLGQVLLSFSVYTNASKILNTNQPSGTLTAVNGIRFISMTWVIMGHSYGNSMVVAENGMTFLSKMLKRFTFQAISNATVSVDTFFTLSGLLVAYLCLKEMKKRNGAKRFNWGMFYFHRFWRLTPPYMLFLMFYVCLEKYWSDGPLWPQEGTEINDCKASWWRNLLYINNLVKPLEQCMGWGWYLANDMQFYVLSPLMLIPLYYSKFLGSLSCATFLLVSVISTGVISKANEFGATIISLDPTKTGDYYEKLYVKPWCRVGPYAIGFFTGYLLYKTDCKIKIPKILNLLGWATATAIALAVLYGLYNPDTGFADLNMDLSALYNATNRSAWGLAVCWVILACATGHGGFINTLLSWKALIPLSRLTYCAYLVHLVVIDVYSNSKRSLIYFTDLEAIYFFLGHLCLSYATAFVVSLAFEAPMMGLEKAILGRKKNS